MIAEEYESPCSHIGVNDEVKWLEYSSMEALTTFPRQSYVVSCRCIAIPEPFYQQNGGGGACMASSATSLQPNQC